MKRILLTALIILALCFSLNAQRSADLRLRVDYPKDTAYIRVNSQYRFKATIFNDGTDTVRLSDTIAMYILIDGDTALTFSGIFRKYRVLSAQITPGDSMVIDEPGIFTSASSKPYDYCIFIKPLNYADPINDSHLANNKSCATVFVGNRSGIQAIDNTADFAIYPNPVNSTFRINGEDEVMSYRMTDMEGRAIDLLETGPGEFDCSKIQASGMYLLSVTTRQGTNTIRIMVAK